MVANSMIAFSKSRIYIYILPRNNLNKNYFRFSKETNQKERRKSTSYAEGNEGVAAI
jgi:hypothetical protein